MEPDAVPAVSVEELLPDGLVVVEALPEADGLVVVEELPDADGLVVEELPTEELEGLPIVELLPAAELGEPAASRWRRASARQSICAVPVSEAHLARSSGVASAASAPVPMVEPEDTDGAELVDGLEMLGELEELEDVEGLEESVDEVDGLVLDGLVVEGLVTLGDVVDELEPDDVLPGPVLVCASTAPLANVVATTTARVCNRM